MATVQFSVVPGSAAPAGAEALALTNIRPVVAPAGPVKAFIDGLTGSYSQFQLARIGQTYFDLLDSGLLAKLDGLFIRGRTAADSLRNWTGGANATAVGAAFTPGTGFVLDGVDDYLDMGFDPTLFTLNSASAFVLINQPAEMPSTAEPLLGRLTGSDVIRLYPAIGSGTQASERLNAATGAVADYTGTRAGLWAASRSGDTNGIFLNGAQLATAEVVATEVPPSITIGRNGSAYGDWTVKAFGYGGYLTAGEQATLTGILAAINARI